MRINVYTEELLPNDSNDPVMSEIVTAEYISTGEKMTNYGLRIYLKSHPDLHYVPPRDDDRSAITFWCGAKEKNIFAFLEAVKTFAYHTLNTWREKTIKVQNETEKAETERKN